MESQWPDFMGLEQKIPKQGNKMAQIIKSKRVDPLEEFLNEEKQ